MQVLVGDRVGVDVAAAGAALDAHVTDGHALVHGHARDGVARVLVGEAHPAVHAQLVDDVEDDVLRGHARAQPAAHLDAPDLELVHRQGLGGQHVAHLRGADAKGDGAERAVGGGVGIAAADGHARLGESVLRAHHVDDALLAIFRREVADAVLLHAGLQGAQHALGQRVLVGAQLAGGGDDVVHGGKGALGEQHLELALLQHAEGLRRGHLVDQVQPHQELVLPRRQASHRVAVKDFFVQCLSHVL